MSLFTSFWAALDGRALSSLERTSASAAFISSLLECVAFIIRRLRSDAQNGSRLLGEGVDAQAAVHRLVRDQYTRLMEELGSGRLKADPRVSGVAIARGLTALAQIDQSQLSSMFRRVILLTILRH